MAHIINNRMHLSALEAAENVGVHLRTIYGWLRRYQLPRIYVASRVMIAQEDLINFINKRVDRRQFNPGRPKLKKGKNAKEAAQ